MEELASTLKENTKEDGEFGHVVSYDKFDVLCEVILRMVKHIAIVEDDLIALEQEATTPVPWVQMWTKLFRLSRQIAYISIANQCQGFPKDTHRTNPVLVDTILSDGGHNASWAHTASHARRK